MRLEGNSVRRHVQRTKRALLADARWSVLQQVALGLDVR